MSGHERRHFPRRRVHNIKAMLAAERTGPVTAVVDLSEGGAGLEWSLPDAVSVGAPVRLRFLLGGEQTIEIDGRIVRVESGRAGVEFLPQQQDVVRQLLSESRSDD